MDAAGFSSQPCYLFIIFFRLASAQTAAVPVWIEVGFQPEIQNVLLKQHAVPTFIYNRLGKFHILDAAEY